MARLEINPDVDLSLDLRIYVSQTWNSVERTTRENMFEEKPMARGNYFNYKSRDVTRGFFFFFLRFTHFRVMRPVEIKRHG